MLLRYFPWREGLAITIVLIIAAASVYLAEARHEAYLKKSCISWTVGVETRCDVQDDGSVRCGRALTCIERGDSPVSTSSIAAPR